jgi:ORF6N domain
VPAQLIERRIYLIRGQKVMFDSDLAQLYQSPTKAFNQAVKRNIVRFPEDFMFQLTGDETDEMNRSQIVTGSQKHRDPRFRPYAFTELGVAMLSSVLNSDRAVQMNILIMRAFVKLREQLATNTELAREIERIGTAQKQHARALQEHASILVSVVQDIQRLKNPPATRAIGFVVRNSKKK